MALRIKVLPSAESDLDEIAEYTIQSWGPVQSRKYNAAIRAGFGRLRKFPLLGQDRSDLDSGLRCLPVHEHRVFYRVRSDLIFIERVLHSRENTEAAFNASVDDQTQP